jgi:hypothetical protein
MENINGTTGNDTLFVDSGRSNQTLFGLAGNDYLDALPGSGNNILDGGDGDDELYGFQKDRLIGGDGNDTLNSDGNGGNTLEGGSGDDWLFADRNDVVIGGAGNDIIFGGLGSSTLTGGAGQDVFWIANAEVPNTANIINDFNPLQDTIRVGLSEVTKLSDLAFAKSGINDATISFGGKELAIIKNTAVGSLNTNTVVVDANAPNNLGNNATSFDFINLPKLGTTAQGQDILLGGFSGLFFQGLAANGNLKFITHTDRGPNGENSGAKRPFALPNFQPELVQFELNQASGAISITKRTGLFGLDGATPLTGLPNLQAGAAGTAYTDETPIDLLGNQLTNSPLGADLEGIAVDAQGEYWMVDEYRPAIYHFDAAGKLLNRFIPQGTATASTPAQPAGTFGSEVLPAVYAQRRNNRGFEAVALEGNKLYAFIQSPIDNPDTTNDANSRASRNLRILEFDIVTKQVTGEYIYVLEGLAATDKIGDAVSLGNGKFAVVERDDNETANSNKLIYNIDIKAATNINNPANFTLPAGKTIEQLTIGELATANIKTVSKNLIVNGAKAGYTGVQKLEGLALVDSDTLALLNDNDFGITGTTNNANGSVSLKIDNVPSRLGLLDLAQPLPVVTTLAPLAPNSSLLRVHGGGLTPTSILFSKISRQAHNRNEIGVFSIDDNSGTVNGIKPGESSYLTEVMKRSKVVFSALDSSGVNNQLDQGAQRNLSLAGNTNLGFYLIADSTSDEIKAGAANPNVLFSFPTANSGIQNAQVTFANGITKIAWEDTRGGGDRDFDDLVMQIETAPNVAPIGNSQQGDKEIFDLSLVTTTAKATFEVKRDAGFNNRVGFYKIEDVEGTIKVGNTLIKPTEGSIYRQAVIQNRLAGIDLFGANGQTLTSTGDFQGGALYAPFLISNSATANADFSNVYTAYSLGNSDKVDHIRLLADNTFGFEDLAGGGDRDFNDVIVKATFVV